MTPPDGASRTGRRYVVEVAGVAGSGKSSLARVLCRDPEWRLADPFHTRTPEHLALVVRSVPRVLPILAGGLAPGPRLSWADLKLLAYVSGWHRMLGRRLGDERGVTLFDQGPIYALVRLKAQAKNVTTRAPFDRWWNDMLDRWSRELGAVVWLDAPDHVLWERINGRVQPHTTKGSSLDAGHRFISTYRGLFEEVLQRLTAPGGPEILRFDTGAIRSEDIAEQLRSMLLARSTSSTGGRGA